MKVLLIGLVILISASAFADDSRCTYSWDHFEENDGWNINDERVGKFGPMIEEIMAAKGYSLSDSKTSTYSLGIWLKDAVVGNIGFSSQVRLKNKLTGKTSFGKGSNVLERTIPAVLAGGLLPYDGSVSTKRALKKIADCI